MLYGVETHLAIPPSNFYRELSSVQTFLGNFGIDPSISNSLRAMNLIPPPAILHAPAPELSEPVTSYYHVARHHDEIVTWFTLCRIIALISGGVYLSFPDRNIMQRAAMLLDSFSVYAFDETMSKEVITVPKLTFDRVTSTLVCRHAVEDKPLEPLAVRVNKVRDSHLAPIDLTIKAETV